MLLISIFIAGDINILGRPVSDCDNCSEDEYCYEGQGMIQTYRCYNRTPWVYYEIKNNTPLDRYTFDFNFTDKLCDNKSNNSKLKISEININGSFWNDVDEKIVAPKGWGFGEGEYCVPDYGAGNYAICDVIVYPNGSNETGACSYYNDLVMHYKCRDIGNATIVRGVRFG